MRTLRLAVPNCNPWYQVIQDGNISRVEGTAAIGVEFLTRLMNIRPVLVDAGVCDYGKFLGPNNWSGVMGYFQRKEIDISIDASEANEEFLKLVGFGNGMDVMGCTILSGPSNQTHKEIGSLIGSVSWRIWLAMFSSLLAVSFISFLMSKVSRKFPGNIEKMEFSLKEFIQMLILFFGLLWEKGTKYSPPSSAHRIILASWLLFVIVLNTLLEAKFFEVLAVVETPERIDSMSDIMKNPRKTLMSVNTMNTEIYLQTSEVPHIKSIWKRLQKTGKSMDLPEFFSEEVMNQLSYGSSIIIAEEKWTLGSILEFYCMKSVRPYYIAKETYGLLPMVPYYRKDLEPDIIEDYVKAWTSIFEHGFGERFIEDMFKHSEPCLNQNFHLSQIQGETLQLRNLANVFEILFAGSLIACVVLGLEILFNIFDIR